jgi:formylglycine-generating enzyme
VWSAKLARKLVGGACPRLFGAKGLSFDGWGKRLRRGVASVSLKWVPSVAGAWLTRVHVLVLVALACLIATCDERAPGHGPLPLAKLSVGAFVSTPPRYDEPVPPALEPPPPECPPGMVQVEGEYCPKVQHRCVTWLDPPGRFRRCQRYERPARCLSPRRSLRFCIERGEHVRSGAALPVNGKNFLQAERICAEAGKRLCRESEWNFACEGETLLPYPYGWERDASACNADHVLLAAGSRTLRDLRSAPGAYPRCSSPFGVLDMTGNLEELVRRDDRPTRPALKGAHWLPGRNHCRAHQTIHGRGYAGTETGFRCCSDLPPEL